MQVVQAIGAVKVSNRTSVGIRTLNIKQKVVGMVLRGTKKVYHDDRVTIAEAGDIFLLNEGLHHIEECADNQLFEQILFYITAEELHKHIVTLIQQYQLECFTTHHCRKCQSNNFVVSKPNKSLSEFFSSINNTFNSTNSQIGEHLRQMRTIELVYHILCSGDGCLKNQLLQGADIDRVKFMGCIYDHILKECTVESLAAATHRSPTSFKKEFRRYFHTSPHKWFINQRLQIAHTMLLSTDQTVEQIGNYCCLHNPSHFISRFRERYNMTPKVFRQVARGER